MRAVRTWRWNVGERIVYLAQGTVMSLDSEWSLYDEIGAEFDHMGTALVALQFDT